MSFFAPLLRKSDALSFAVTAQKAGARPALKKASGVAHDPYPGQESPRHALSSIRPLQAHLESSGTPIGVERFAIQAKLEVSDPGDELEREADRAADRVMRMPLDETMPDEPLQIPESVHSSSSVIKRACAACATTPDDEREHAQRSIDPAPNQLEAPPNTDWAKRCHVARARGGEPMPAAVRQFMEPRFGWNFCHVKVHRDETADSLNRGVSARAFTFGRDVFFKHGEFQPATERGRRLIAHELAHVVQQARGRAPTVVHRACGSKAIGTPSGCVEVSGDVEGPRFLFKKNCDELLDAKQQTALEALAGTINASDTVNIHGYASVEGPVDFNIALSCARATKVATLLEQATARSGVPSVRFRLYQHGPTPGPAVQKRSVTVEVAGPTPTPTPEPQKPGSQTPCERTCEFDFNRCLNFSTPIECISRRGACLRGCAGAKGAFEVCVRLLQPPVEISGCNHAYVETPKFRYAIITPCTDKLSFALPSGGIAKKTNVSPDPCNRRPTCLPCVPKPGVTDLEACFASQYAAYAAPSVHKLFGPNSNTFAGTLARGCCSNMSPLPAEFGCLPGWDDPPAPAAHSDSCPSGPPTC